MIITPTISKLWSWWSESTNEKDESARKILTVSVIILLSVWYVALILKWINNTGKSRLPPGPRGLPLVGNLLYLDPELHTYFVHLAKSYGPIFKLQFGWKLGIVVSSPSLAKEVLKDQDSIFANRDVPAAARVIAYGASDIVWTPYGPEWRMLRRLCVRELLSNASLKAVYDLRRRELRGTIGHLYSRSGQEIDIGEQMFFTVLNVITSMTWGGTLKGKERSSIGSEFRQVVGEVTEILGKPNVSDFFPVLERFDVQGINTRMDRLFRRLDPIFNSIVDQRIKMDMEDGSGKIEGDGSKDFLQILVLKLKDEGDSKMPFTMTHLKALLMDMVVGGTDTTSNTVEWTMAEIMQNPEVMKKAQEELDAVVGKDNMVEEMHISKLAYLDAVVKEALRLHPALPLLVPRCPSLSCNVGGYTIPKGSRVFVNVWAIHRDPSIWENPLKFDPERFLGSTGKWDYSGNDFSYFPFGSGRRICAGIPMAERMMKYSLASLLHSFDWKLPEGAKLDLSEKFGIVLKKAGPLVAIPTPRLSNPEIYVP